MLTRMSESRGVVHEAGGGSYTVRLDDGRTVVASLRGRIKKETRADQRVVIGDRVTVSGSGEAWTIDEIEPRATALVRRGRGSRAPKPLAANLDRVFAVVSLREPTATTTLIDRMLALVEWSGMHPTLVLNKVDLDGAAVYATQLTRLYESVGYRVLTTSALERTGVDALAAEACRGSSAFIGPSGAGKSSLLNALDPDLRLRTGELSRKTGTGRHTTVGSRLLDLGCGGLVADTPGFGDVSLWSVAPEDVAGCFPEIARLADGCRFRGCTHLHEPGCAVLAALGNGDVHESRHDSYRALREEAEGQKEY